jgi:hypothetical protein
MVHDLGNPFGGLLALAPMADKPLMGGLSWEKYAFLCECVEYGEPEHVHTMDSLAPQAVISQPSPTAHGRLVLRKPDTFVMPGYQFAPWTVQHDMAGAIGEFTATGTVVPVATPTEAVPPVKVDVAEFHEAVLNAGKAISEGLKPLQDASKVAGKQFIKMADVLAQIKAKHAPQMVGELTMPTVEDVLAAITGLKSQGYALDSVRMHPVAAWDMASEYAKKHPILAAGVLKAQAIGGVTVDIDPGMDEAVVEFYADPTATLPTPLKVWGSSTEDHGVLMAASGPLDVDLKTGDSVTVTWVDGDTPPTADYVAHGHPAEMVAAAKQKGMSTHDYRCQYDPMYDCLPF